MADQEIVFYDEDVGYDDDLFYDGTLDPTQQERRRKKGASGGGGAASAGAAAAAASVSEEYILANIECGAYLHHVNGNVLEERWNPALKFRGKIKKKNGITSTKPRVSQHVNSKLLKVTANLEESNVRATIVGTNNNRIKTG